MFTITYTSIHFQSMVFYETAVAQSHLTFGAPAGYPLPAFRPQGSGGAYMAVPLHHSPRRIERHLH